MEFSNDKVYGCDFIVSATGVTPNTAPFDRNDVSTSQVFNFRYEIWTRFSPNKIFKKTCKLEINNSNSRLTISKHLLKEMLKLHYRNLRAEERLIEKYLIAFAVKIFF